MTLLSPPALLLLALIAPIIALYLLKLRRQDRVVSSTYLWQRFVRDVEANAPWQKLRRNLLLLLQILFLLFLVLALARPTTPAEGVAGQGVVLILDTSGSMAATDGGNNGQTRLDAAKAAARDLVANLPDNARVTVLAAAGGEVETLTSASQDRRQVLEVIGAAQVTALNSNLDPALTLAEAIVAREPGADIVLLSDGVVELPERLSAPVRFVPVGQSGANQAISVLSVTPNPGDGSTMFVQVSNYSQQPAQRRLALYVDGTPFTAFDLAVPPGGHVEHSLENLPAAAQTVEAVLAPSETDPFTLDDRAWVVVRSSEPVQATLITPGNFFLQTALGLLKDQQFGSGLELTVISPEDWQAASPPDNSQSSNLRAEGPLWATFQPSNLHIFDSTVPDQLPPGNLLFIAPPAAVPGLFDVMGQMAGPAPQPVQADDPLLQNVDLSVTQILTTTVLSPTNWSRTIVAAEIQPNLPSSIPLLLAGELEGRRVAVLSFSLQQSDLPLRPAFPILMANLVNYLAPSPGALIPATLAPGEALSISIPAQIKRVRLTPPAGAGTVLPTQAGRASLPPLSQLGLYTVTFESADGTVSTARLAVNFFDPLESAIAPRPALELTNPAEPGPALTSLAPAYQEWWRPLAFGALVLLVIEWLVYQRSAVFRYWDVVLRRRAS
ncbi:MAG: VWA domain-containing protein [Anaerolineae bacterium]|nr:VWA domain-containing protein [Anaerolineae bacterium]